MGAILGIIFLVVVVAVGLMFLGANGWTSRRRDRQGTAKERDAMQRANPTTDKRGTGIN